MVRFTLFVAFVFGLLGQAIAQCPNCPQSARTPIVQSRASYTPRWHNYDGLSPRAHLEQMHGVASAGLTETQVRMRMDADHNAWGPQHRGGAVSRSVLRSGYARATARRTLFPRLWRR